MKMHAILSAPTAMVTCLCMAGLFFHDAVRADQIKPLKVFVLVGQSNMQGHANVETLEHVGMDPATAPLLAKVKDAKGRPKVIDDVWISSLSNSGEKHGRLTTGFGANDQKIGPELMFGITIHELLDEPVLLIKTSWGGKSLHTDFRPPSAGPYVFQPHQIQRFEQQGKDLESIRTEKREATGRYYRLMIEHVRSVLSDIRRVYPDFDSSAGYELAGLVWFQGWNDMVDSGTYPNRDQPGGYAKYSELLGHFIRDVRHDLDAPGLPIVIGVMGVNGPTALYTTQQNRIRGVHQNFRHAMAAPAGLPEFQGNVRAVLTENYWDQELAELRTRDNQIGQKIRTLKKQQKMTREEESAMRDQLRKDAFTDAEWENLSKGVSNAEYHYLGSAKIMLQIGEGFAEAMAEMQD
ncbi:sialate O-acetylesterase [Crateriforma conspicua]|uniref:Sialate O-acetylesterase domain-containing protein n=1 Tax=Crateriforma conspicua TaxID=2527996 RepID=A0A5C5XZ33_9PLAN|nr:sialate O-acetylesterase [Crateriforma conspicua]TWT68154.1 hypothetical protein Pan14r_03940 [Crateriforma conspicua]